MKWESAKKWMHPADIESIKSKARKRGYRLSGKYIGRILNDVIPSRAHEIERSIRAARGD